jgi:hypothetical protein
MKDKVAAVAYVLLYFGLAIGVYVLLEVIVK